MFELSLWWQGFFAACGLYFVFLMGQVIGYYKKGQDSLYDNEKKW